MAMPAIQAGNPAPTFLLPLLSGGNFSLRDSLQQGPVLLAFFKITCPVCQFALPYLERMYASSKSKNVVIVGVSQNAKEQTAAFAQQYGITFPIALDDPRQYRVSNSYGLTHVPSIFYIAEDGNIEVSSVGWSKDDLAKIAREIGERTPAGSIEFLHAGEEVPAYRSG
jgi:peroxiredoxin